MPPFRIIKIHIPFYFGVQLVAILRWFQVDFLVFDTAPEPFNENVVNRPALTVHAEPGLLKAAHVRCESRAGELATLVGIEYLGRPVPGHRHFKALPAPFGRHGVRQRPANDKAAIKVDDGHQVHMPVANGNVGYVHPPDLIGALYPHPPQQVREDGVPGPLMRPARVGAGANGMQAHFPVEPPNTLRVHPVPVLT